MGKRGPPPAVSASEIEEGIQEYMREIRAANENAKKEKDRHPPTFLEAAKRLGISYETWRRYREGITGNQEICAAIKKADDKITTWWVKQLGTRRSVAGPIFWLKNRAGWSDSREVRQVVEERSGEPALKDFSDDQLEQIAEELDRDEDNPEGS